VDEGRSGARAGGAPPDPPLTHALRAARDVAEGLTPVVDALPALAGLGSLPQPYDDPDVAWLLEALDATLDLPLTSHERRLCSDEWLREADERLRGVVEDPEFRERCRRVAARHGA